MWTGEFTIYESDTNIKLFNDAHGKFVDKKL